MIARIITGILLLVFAFVQYNDPDPWLWILAYSLVGALSIWSAWKAVSPLILYGLIIIFAITAAWYVPNIMQWVSEGMPSIIGSMKASSPYIEWTRVLGLILCLTILYWLSRSKYVPKGIN